MNAEILQLDIWRGDWGLPSVDTDCLQVLAYAKFSGISLKLNTTSNLFRTPHGKLPILRYNGHSMDTVVDILRFLRKKDSKADFALSAKQHAEIAAYDVLLKEKLTPALQFVWWIDQKNLNELSRPWYCKALSFPLNFYYPGKFERQAENMMEVLYSPEENVENKVYSEAQKCLTLLSERLGDKDFFYGSQATSLDAIVYGYLAPLLKAPFPNAALQNHLKACTNLVRFISRISQKHFESDYQSYEKLKAEKDAQKKAESENDFPNKRRNQVLAALFAVFAMMGYALSSGIVEVPVRENEALEMSAEYMVNDEDIGN